VKNGGGESRAAASLVTASSRVFDRNDPEGVIGVLIAERQVFARREMMGSKSVTYLIIVRTLLVVVKDPTGMLVAAGLMGEKSELFIVAAPETADPALIAMRVPERGIDMTTGIERSDELIAVLA